MDQAIPPTSESKKPAGNPLMGMRDELLRGPASKFGVIATPEGVWGCLMEMGNTRGSATLVSLMDGTTSIYISTGGGYLGGGGHENVAAATKAFVTMAGTFIASMSSTTEFPMPSAGRVRFYVLSTTGVFTMEADENDLGYGRHCCAPLFHAGHEVITQFRLVTDKQQRRAT